MGLGAEGNFGPERIEFALADGGDEGGDAVTEVGLAPGPAAAQGMVVGKPGDGTDGSVGVGGGVYIEDGAVVEINIGGGAHPPGGLDGRVESNAENASGDIVFLVWQAAFLARDEFDEGVVNGKVELEREVGAGADGYDVPPGLEELL